ncbi:hypothetical protein BDV11DRAFT_213425 [Aspergillus similis]
MENQGTPKLTGLERIGPKGYLRYVFPFRPQDNYDLDEVARVVQAGYDVLTKRIPVSAAGVMKFQRQEDQDSVGGGVLVKDLRDSFPSSYAGLEAKSFPLAAFNAETLCRRSANFIRGRLLLAWCILYMAGDGKSFYLWTKVWAEECRRAQGPNIAEPLEDHAEYTLLPFTPPGAPPKMMSQSHPGQVIYFPKESLAVLKAEASPANATQLSDQLRILTNDALLAFPKIHPDTLGCFLEYVAVSVPIRKMLGELNIADLAVLIRKALFQADKSFTDDVVESPCGLDLNCTGWNGCQVVLPMLPDGGNGGYCRCRVECLDRLMKDPLRTRFGVAR